MCVSYLQDCHLPAEPEHVLDDEMDQRLTGVDINKDVGVHTKVSLNVRHRVVSPARIAERTASLEIRLKL